MYYNGGYGGSYGSKVWFKNEDTSLSVSSTTDETNIYQFRLKKKGEGQYTLQSVYDNKYLTVIGGKVTFNETEPSETGYYWQISEDQNGNFCFAFKNIATNGTVYSTYKILISSQASPLFITAGSSSFSSYRYINIYKLEQTKTASFYYYDAKKKPLNANPYAKSLSSTASENTLSNLTKKYPKYISATYYSDDTFTNEVPDSYEVTGNETFYVITSYNKNFLYPHNSETYFALASGNIYLGKDNNGSTINHDNCSNFALLLKGDWYNNYQILNKDKVPLDGSNEYDITWTESSAYRWEIDDDGYIKSATSGNYLQIGANNSLFNPNPYSKDASPKAAETILKGMTAEYVGQYDESQTGSVTFDDLVKGNNTLDFTNGTYYFVENATNESSLLSSNVETTYGNTPSAGGIAMSTAKNFSGLWKYEGGQFVHANSGLKLTLTGLDGTGATWSKTATGTDCVYTLNDGTHDLEIGGNSNWKFRIANSMTISLTNKEGKSYATTCAPVPVKLSDSDAENTTLYIEKSHTENKISFGKAEAVAANTGIFIENTKGDASVTLLFAKTGDESEATSPILAGTTVKLSLSGGREDYRTLGFNASGEIGFFKPASSIAAIPANRAFLYLNGISLTNAFYIDFDGTTTSIDELLPAADVLGGNAPVYDLSGRRIQGTLHKGIYIQNGRKFMVK